MSNSTDPDSMIAQDNRDVDVFKSVDLLLTALGLDEFRSLLPQSLNDRLPYVALL